MAKRSVNRYRGYFLTDSEMKRERGPRRAKRGMLGKRESDGKNPRLEKRARKLPKPEIEES